MNCENKYISDVELAAIVGVSRDQIVKYINNLQVIKIGARFFMKRVTAIAYLNQNGVKTVSNTKTI